MQQLIHFIKLILVETDLINPRVGQCSYKSLLSRKKSVTPAEGVGAFLQSNA